ncbi:MAG: ATP-binding protein [Bacteroidales bacterium]|jgi:PAS domain S-box-containing protein|nr:ATP-binding protein [Bacteroidales bacterium]
MNKSIPGISEFGYAVYEKLPNNHFERVKDTPVFLMFITPENKHLKGHSLNTIDEEISSFHIEDLLAEASQEMDTKHAFVRVENVIDYLLKVFPIDDNHFLCVVENQTRIASKSIFFQIAEKSYVGIVIVNHSGRILYCNPSVVKMLESPSRQATMEINMLEFDLLVKQGFSQKLKHTLSDGKSQSFEAKYISKWGKSSWLKIYIEPEYNRQTINGAWLFLDDITSRVEAEKMLEREIEVQNLIFEIATESIDLSIDEVDNAIQKYFRMIGEHIHADRVYGFDYNFEKKTTNNTHEWCAKGILPEIENLQEVPIDRIPEWTRPHLKGEALIVKSVPDLPEGNLKAILSPQNIKSLITYPLIKGNKCMGFIGFDFVKDFHHITAFEKRMLISFSYIMASILERKETQKAIVESNQALIESKKAAEQFAKNAENANRAKGHFLANMSHEIRTPLNGVIGFTSLLENSKLDEQQRKFLEHISVSANALMGIINDVLDLSKIEADKIRLHNSNENIIQICEQALDLINPATIDKDIELGFDLKNQPPELLNIDAMRFRQILTNLLGNASKFTYSGKIVLELSFDNFDPRDQMIDLHIAVVDTGIGISEDVKNSLLEPFSQADVSTTRKYGGTGLGLTIADRIIRLMGGVLKIKSEPKVGSEFAFTIRQKAENYPQKFSFHDVEQSVLFCDESDVLCENDRLLNLFYQHVYEISDVEILINKLLDGDCPVHVYCTENTINLLMQNDSFKKLQSQNVNFRLIILQNSNAEKLDSEIICPEFAAKCSFIMKPLNFSKLKDIIEEQNFSEEPGVLDINTSLMTGSHLTFLIAEDVDINRILIRRMLNKLWPSAIVLEAEDGNQAAEIAIEKMPDLVLMDIQMPELNGFDAFERIKANLPENNMIPVIALTASATDEIKAKAYEIGMDSIAVKPVTIESLKASVVEIFIKCGKNF